MKSQGVIHIRRITIRRDGQLIETKHHILTFQIPTIPESVYAGYIKLPVKTYIPDPLRCYQCQGFGHAKLNCRGSLTCGRCAQKGHEIQQCSAKEKCINCSGDHPSYSRSCPCWILEKQITSIKVKENISYPEARRRVQAQTPIPGVSYAFVTKQTFFKNCSCYSCVKYSETHNASPKASDSDSTHSTYLATETRKAVKRKSKTKSQTSLTLNLAKRGLTHKDLL
ncbi:uncharacterized protein LOC129959342 [Argiope bruennichi]|uniref:uncharacterized protein LOC129959342 n=1 Tax=Argiope bruennichi TaxID=94029 RepID=UPI0024948DEA|nr:uncharacterized protein LOC129959342 [Argiope bruennichi]